ncbi:hypothetical protein [Evansella halocellulosilytica]|uniref:hypothetical protein n=1 Tax=Evansella halocellulosilytica TaxID=2011013 RepID=UPI000BB9A51A|nr:hypothetical protein [Evansella halocellulosilytica]
MKINFTKKQYKQLLNIAFLGNWTANSTRLPDEIHEEYHDIYQYICSFAKNFGYDNVITYDKKFDQYFPTLEFEEPLQPIIDENDDRVFWEELSNRLAKRDIAMTGEEFQTNDDYIEKLFKAKEKYEIEFGQNGIENLVIKERTSK